MVDVINFHDFLKVCLLLKINEKDNEESGNFNKNFNVDFENENYNQID